LLSDSRAKFAVSALKPKRGASERSVALAILATKSLIYEICGACVISWNSKVLSRVVPRWRVWGAYKLTRIAHSTQSRSLQVIKHYLQISNTYFGRSLWKLFSFFLLTFSLIFLPRAEWVVQNEPSGAKVRVNQFVITLFQFTYLLFLAEMTVKSDESLKQDEPKLTHETFITTFDRIPMMLSIFTAHEKSHVGANNQGEEDSDTPPSIPVFPSTSSTLP
jgi:hypothetical protein